MVYAGKKTCICIAMAALLAVSLTVCGAVRAGDVETIEWDKLPYTAPGQPPAAEQTASEGAAIVQTGVEAGSVTLDCSLNEKGVVGVRADVSTRKKLKAKVSKQNDAVYYNLTPYTAAKLPLQYGSGAYSLELFENIEGTQYQRFFEKELHISMSDDKSVFLCSSQIVDFDNPEISARLTGELVKNAVGNREKAKAVHEYVVTHIAYDYQKVDALDPGYIPDAEEILQKGSGICYDYAAVLAVMLREAGVPAKLVKGYRDGLKEYHAWNEFYADGEWLTMDATCDAVARANGGTYDMVKDPGLYHPDRVF